MSKCLDPDPSSGQISTSAGIRFKLFSVGLGCQPQISPRIRWLPAPFAPLARGTREICATSPTLKGEHRKHFLGIDTGTEGSNALCSFLSKGHCKRDTSELTSVTAGDDYCGLAEMCSCWDSVQWSCKVQTSVRDPLAKFPHFFMLLLVFCEGKAFVFVHLLFIGRETYLCIPTPIHFAECHSLEISFFLPLGSFPFELLAFAYIQYCMMVHCLGGSATNRSCWHFCWHSTALMMVRTRATRLGLSSSFSLL